MGILFCYILFVYLDKKGVFERRRQLLEGTPCIAALVKLEKNISFNWSFQCEKNQLLVTIKEPLPDKLSDPKKKKQYLYYQLANHFSLIAHSAPEVNLEKILLVELKLLTEKLELFGAARGLDVALLKKIEDPQKMLKHLHKTFRVKEVVK
jgi:hypothetical protein